MIAVEGQSWRRGFTLGFVAGLIYFSGTLYWITRVMVLYGGLPTVVAVLVNASLVVYLALYPAIFGMAMARLTQAGGKPALMAAPLVWVTTEVGRTYLFTGFPWVLLGYSQAAVLPVAQLASVTGVYGVSALAAAVAAGLAHALIADRADDRHPYRPLLVAAAVVAVVAAWGSWRVSSGALVREGDPVRIGLVQPNTDLGERTDSQAGQILLKQLQATRVAVSEGAQLVIWPESAMPYPFADDVAGATSVRHVSSETHVPILLGSDEIERGPALRYYNSAFMVHPDGTLGGVYRKMHLVPFGEYVPQRRVFFFASKLVEAVSDFTPGDTATLLHVDDRHVLNTSICYEVVYPDLVRSFVKGGSELLTTITNDAWFGQTSAPYQHFAQASMRAIENGRYLVRAANTGISGIVDPYGRATASSRLFEPAVLVGDARFIRSFTIYTRTGDWFAYACMFGTLALLVVLRARVQ